MLCGEGQERDGAGHQGDAVGRQLGPRERRGRRGEAEEAEGSEQGSQEGECAGHGRAEGGAEDGAWERRDRRGGPVIGTRASRFIDAKNFASNMPFVSGVSGAALTTMSACAVSFSNSLERPT